MLVIIFILPNNVHVWFNLYQFLDRQVRLKKILINNEESQ